MIKYIIFLLVFNSLSTYSIWMEPYDLSSNKRITISYSNYQYDYYVIGGYLNGHTKINIEFTPLAGNMNAYYVTTKIVLDSTNINEFIERFYNMDLYVPSGVTHNITYTTNPEYPYMYFAFRSLQSGMIEFDFKTNSSYDE